MIKIKRLISAVKSVPVLVSDALMSGDIVERIHHEFNTAADKAVDEAKKILNIKVPDKGTRLAKIGFANTPESLKAKEMEETVKRGNEELAAISDYRVRYPFHKFILERQVAEICKKYSLVCGDVNLFKGFVPEKNLKEVEAFRVREEDKVKSVWTGSWITAAMQMYNQYGLSFFQSARQQRRNNFGIVIPQGELKSPEQPSGEKEPEMVAPKMKICAPIKDMDMRYMEIEDGYKLRNIPDPVVLQPVRYGYLIVTAWGEEASDPIVVNEIGN
jgi:hypothetical protein